jgi:hypothetical protein
MKPRLRVYHTYQPRLRSEDQLAMIEAQEAHAKKELAEMARDTLAWSTNLVNDKRYRLCPCGCGLIHLSRFKNDKHIDPSELIADWKSDKPGGADHFMQAPVEIPPPPAVSVAQIHWARSVVDQLGRKTDDQIARENNVSWRQLLHWARSSTEGLPERATKRKPAKEGKPKAPKMATRKAKEA